MSRLDTINGVYKFKQIDLYTGAKRINKQIALANLLEIQQLLDSQGIYWGFIFGTVLGAVRENDFITHDEDIDLFILDEDENKLKSSLFILRENEFELIRYDKGGIYSFMKNGEYIDFYIFMKKSKGIYHCGSYYVLEKHLKDTKLTSFLGGEFRIPSDDVEYLEITYGPNWMTPIEYFDFKKSKWKIFKDKFIIKVKRFLPLPLFRWLQNKNGNHRKIKFLERVKEKGLEHLIDN